VLHKNIDHTQSNFRPGCNIEFCTNKSALRKTAQSPPTGEPNPEKEKTSLCRSKMKISFRFIRHQQWFREVHVHIVQRATRVLRQVDHNQIRQVGKSQLWWLQNERDHWRDNRTSALRQNVEVQHVRRSANRVAHVLAKYAISQLLNNTWIDECPNIIQNVVVADYECTTWLSFYNIHWFSKKKKKKRQATTKGFRFGDPIKIRRLPAHKS